MDAERIKKLRELSENDASGMFLTSVAAITDLLDNIEQLQADIAAFKETNTTLRKWWKQRQDE